MKVGEIDMREVIHRVTAAQTLTVQTVTEHMKRLCCVFVQFVLYFVPLGLLYCSCQSHSGDHRGPKHMYFTNTTQNCSPVLDCILDIQ